MSSTITVIGHNHFDPTWRRCFKRQATYNGVTVRGYAEIEELVVKAWLGLASRGYTLNEGQAAVWRMYLERNPADLALLQAEIKAGRLAVMMAGETVQDSNMPVSEGLVRNFLVAMPLYRQLCGEEHPALAAAWLEDAFGNSAKAFGDFTFELYEFQPNSIEPKGTRLAVWEQTTLEARENLKFWDETRRMYEFRLQWDQAPAPGKKLVLVARFSSPFSERLFAQYIFISGE